MDRALSAAQASLHAGAFDEALGLAAGAEAGALDELQRARVGLHPRAHRLRLRTGSRSSPGAPGGGEAARSRSILSSHARPTSTPGVRRSSRDGWPRREASLEVSRAAKAVAAPAGAPRPSDLLLDGLATADHGRARRRCADAEGGGDGVRRRRLGRGQLPLGLARRPCRRTCSGTRRRWHAISDRQLRRAREVGAVVRLPIDLTALAILVAWRGDFARAAAAIAESGRGDGGHRHSARALQRDAARGPARTRGRGDLAHRLGCRAGDRRRPGDRRPVRPVDRGDPLQRPCPLRGGAGRGARTQPTRSSTCSSRRGRCPS